MSDRVLTAAQAVQIVEGLAGAGVRCWVMGGWGIDALLGQQTRPHHDLDLMVNATDLAALDRWLRDHGFLRVLAWPENAPVRMGGQLWDTAFVERHADGRELDIHAVQVADQAVQLLTDDPWDLPSGPLEGEGTISGRAIACITAEAQRATHRGYELPEGHRRDLLQLDRL